MHCHTQIRTLIFNTYHLLSQKQQDEQTADSTRRAASSSARGTPYVCYHSDRVCAHKECKQKMLMQCPECVLAELSMQVLFFCGIHLDEHQELNHPHLFVNYHGRDEIDAAATQDDNESQDRVPEHATSVKVNVQSLPGTHPYPVPVEVNATTTVQHVLNAVELLYPRLSVEFVFEGVQLKAKIKKSWVILEPDAKLHDIDLPNTTLQGFVFCLHFPDAELTAVVRSDMATKNYKVHTYFVSVLEYILFIVTRETCR